MSDTILQVDTSSLTSLAFSFISILFQHQDDAIHVDSLAQLLARSVACSATQQCVAVRLLCHTTLRL
jgi:hypothetical protein